MKVIQIRGCNASGKTTMVKQFIQNSNFEIKEIKVKGIKTYITTNENKSIVILGRYDKKTGGCDLFQNKIHVINTIFYVIANMKPKIIIFEGLIYGLTYKFAAELCDNLKKYNYDYTGICLYLEKNTALERLYKRNGGKAVNESYILNKTKSMMASYKKLLSNGYKVKLYDTSKVKEEDMHKILENEVKR